MLKQLATVIEVIVFTSLAISLIYLLFIKPTVIHGNELIKAVSRLWAGEWAWENLRQALMLLLPFIVFAPICILMVYAVINGLLA